MYVHVEKGHLSGHLMAKKGLQSIALKDINPMCHL